ncbi:hypothetical protein [Cohaesibacter gelatinilyticus]|uniref:Uncharacterized protein n=1 Tax=Cohaesibacter gelatinilyticus TaxID=372072 RepID=A0A285N939_9HYPH|nr:hypothetical protein [Cohaesibacter gelatinilyticus]SNZ05975.1 hypothetical protein SAMN06265368_0253 [Cohaesibacter gelatinilyticus]HAT85270.1 hypothetical protein [Hyphomicrobiales bacterium]
MKSSVRIDYKTASRFGLGVGLAFGLSACANGIGGTTYGTGVSQEEALLNDIQGIAAVSSGDKNQAQIDYSSRPGLVVPPQSSQLPNPLNASNTGRLVNAADWPKDPDLLRKAYHQRLETMNDQERKALLEAIRRMPPEQRAYIIKNDPRVTSFTQIEEPDYREPGKLKEYNQKVRERLAAINAANGKSGGKYKRKYLTQPPEKYRQHSPEVQRELDKVAVEGPEEKESKGLFSKLWPF